MNRLSESVSYCRCDGCRFKYTHLWMYHKCGICGELGHGQLEHNNPSAIENIKQSGINDTLKTELWCKSPECNDPHTHTDTSHVCELCEEYHYKIACPKYIESQVQYKQYDIECPVCREINNVDDGDGSIFGLSEKCHICTINDINYILSKCNHCCMCIECSVMIRTTNVKYTQNIE
jgi:hypothetical protein